MRTPPNTPQDLRLLLEEIDRRINLIERGNIDLKGRRIINAGKHVQDADYVTYQELEKQLREVKAATAKALSSGGASSVVPPVVPPVTSPYPAATHGMAWGYYFHIWYTDYINEIDGQVNTVYITSRQKHTQNDTDPNEWVPAMAANILRATQQYDKDFVLLANLDTGGIAGVEQSRQHHRLHCQCVERVSSLGRVVRRNV